MKDNHIIDLLDNRPLSSLSMAELDQLEAHTAACPDCLRAYESARASLQLIRERASVMVEPPPFFETKVLAAIREQNRVAKPFGFPRCVT